MRKRILRTTVLLAVLALTPALAAERPWGESGDHGRGTGRVARAQEAPTSFWSAIWAKLVAIWDAEGVIIAPGG